MSSSADVAGVDVANVTRWMSDRIPSIATPLSFEPIAGGLSNLTYRVTDQAGARWVLRRPPLGHVLATAHDMGREFRIISALSGTSVPVPPVVGHCEDDGVNGAPFYVMDFVDGIIARSTSDAVALTVDARAHACRSLIDVLASIQEVDIDEVGLGDLGRRESYVDRQLSRWQRQWESTKDRDLPAMEELHSRLSSAVPVQGPATIVHGDYRLDNCILTPDGEIAAVLDWELCTLGDPLADLGLMLVYWDQPTDTVSLGRDGATTLEGFATRAEIIEMYGKRTGRDVSGIGYYVALGYWKLACILQGVLVRYRSGAMGDTTNTDPMADQVNLLALAGSAALDGRIGVIDV